MRRAVTRPSLPGPSMAVHRTVTGASRGALTRVLHKAATAPEQSRHGSATAHTLWRNRIGIVAGEGIVAAL